MARARIDVDRLFAALDEQREAHGLSWRGLAKELGVSPSTLTRVRQGMRPDADGFAAMVAWLGISADRFLDDTDLERRIANSDLVADIGVLLRSRKDLGREDAEMLEQIIRAAYDRVRATD